MKKFTVKRFLAGALSAAMVLTAIPANVYASEAVYVEEDESAAEEQSTGLAGLQEAAELAAAPDAGFSDDVIVTSPDTAAEEMAAEVSAAEAATAEDAAAEEAAAVEGPGQADEDAAAGDEGFDEAPAEDQACLAADELFEDEDAWDLAEDAEAEAFDAEAFEAEAFEDEALEDEAFEEDMLLAGAEDSPEADALEIPQETEEEAAERLAALAAGDGRNIELSVDTPSIYTGQMFEISASAPGADWIEVFFNYENGDRWWEWHDGRDGETLSEAWSPYWREGEYVMVARAHYGEEDYTDSEPVLMTVEALNGPLSVALPDDLPPYLTTEDSLSFTVNKPEHAYEYTVDVWYDPDAEDVDGKIFHEDSYADSLTVNIPKEKIQEVGTGREIKINISARGYKYDETDAERRIPVVDAPAADKVSLRVVKESDGTSADQVQVNEDVRILVSPFGANDRIQAIRIYRGDGFWDGEEPHSQEDRDWWFDEDGNIDAGLNWWDPGVYTVYAEVTFNGRQWYTSEIKTVIVTKAGDVEPFEFTLGKESVTRGEMASVTYGEAENADHYWVDVEYEKDPEAENEDDRWESFDSRANSDEPGSVTFGTADMEPGRYRILAKANGVGYVGRDARNGWLYLTVEEAGLAEDEILLNVNKTELVTGERFSLSAYAPGADSIEIFFDYESGDRWWDWHDGRGGESFTDERQDYWRAGTYALVARAHYGEEEFKDSEPVTMTVEAPNGPLTVALPDDLPPYLTTEDALSFTINKPESAERFSLNVWYDPDDENVDGTLFGEETEGDSLTFSITKEQVQAIGAGKEIKIRADARARGYDRGETEERRIPVVDAPAADKVSLRVVKESDGTSADQVQVNEDVRLLVSPFGANDRIQAIRIYRGDGFWDGEEPHSQEDRDWWFDEDGNIDAGLNWWDPGVYTVYAEVTFNGRQWYTSEIKTVTVTKAGDVEPFEFTLGKESVTRGEMASVTYGEAENADHYWVDVEYEKDPEAENEDDRWESFDSRANSDEPGSVTFGTADMEPGRYRILAKANGVGYVGRDAENGWLYLTVEEAGLADGEILLTVDKTELVTGERFSLSAYAPGADSIEIFFDYESGDRWWDWHDGRNGETFTDERQDYWRAGTYALVARAHYGEEEFKDSEPVLMTVSAPNGPLTVALPEGLPAYLTTEDALSFTVDKPEHADEYTVDVWYDPDAEEVDGNLFHEDSDAASLTVSIPKEKILEVGTGKEIKIRIDARGYGYDGADSGERKIPVVAPAATEKVSIRLVKEDGGTPASEILINEGVRISVAAADPDATGPIKSLRLFDGRGFWNRGGELISEDFPEAFDADGNFSDVTSWWEPGTYSVYAQVTFDDRDGQEDTRTWYDTEVVTVTAKQTDALAPTTFALAKERAGKDDLKGKAIGTIAPVEHAVNYWVDIERWYEADSEHEEPGWYYETSFQSEDPAGIMLKDDYVDGMTSGTYRFRGGADGENGYHYVDANDGSPVTMIFRDPFLTEEEEAAADELRAIIEALPAQVGSADEAAVTRAKEIADSLNDAQKAWLGGEEAAAELTGKAEAAKAQVDKARADEVAALINALPANAGMSESSRIEAARAAYEQLTDDQKALFDSNSALKDSFGKLTAAEKRSDEQKAAADNAAKTEKANKAAADKVTKQLNALKANAGVSDKAAVEAARKAYNALSAAQKKLVSAAALKKLTAAEASVKKAQAAADQKKKEAAAKAAFDMNVKQGATVKVQLKKKVSKIKAVLGEGDAIASVTTSDKKIVTASFKGNVITLKGLKKNKKATITVTTKLGASRSFKVKVQKGKVKTGKIKVTTKKTMKKGEKLDLYKDLGLTITPVTTLDKLSFKSSKKGVAAVSKAGIITAKKAGKAKITVKSGTKKKTITITVK